MPVRTFATLPKGVHFQTVPHLQRAGAHRYTFEKLTATTARRVAPLGVRKDVVTFLPGQRVELVRLTGSIATAANPPRKTRTTATRRKNPPLTVFALANPPRRQQFSARLYTIEYRHKGNGKDYYHNFKPGTQMYALPNGDVLIHRPGAKVWGDFPAE